MPSRAEKLPEPPGAVLCDGVLELVKLREMDGLLKSGTRSPPRTTAGETLRAVFSSSLGLSRERYRALQVTANASFPEIPAFAEGSKPVMSFKRSAKAL